MRVGLHLSRTQSPLSIMLCMLLRSHGGISEAADTHWSLKQGIVVSYISSDSDISP